MAKLKNGQEITMYKEKPLVRNENTIYYGDMSGPFVAVLQIMDTKQFKDLTLPTKVMVQILSTDESLPLQERIKKKTEKNNFYTALNIADIWLTRILDEK